MRDPNKQAADDELREEYQLSKVKDVTRGKYAARFKEGSNVVVLAPDVAKAFPNNDAVNEALRLLMNIAESALRRAS